MKFKVELPITIYVDNTGSIDLAKSWMSSGNSKHIDIRHHFVRNLVDEGIIDITFVAGDDNLADSFTKNIDQSRYLSHRDKMMQTSK